MVLRGYEPDDLLPIGNSVYVLEDDIAASREVVEELDGSRLTNRVCQTFYQ